MPVTIKQLPRAVRPRAALVAARPVVPSRAPIYVAGMHGMGDNLHQRAIVRELMAQGPVYLETPWPAIYHDLVGARLKLVRKPTALRTQAKNAAREQDKYEEMATRPSRQVRIWYPPEEVRRRGSVLAAMMAGAGTKSTDFSLPIPDAWKHLAQRFLRAWSSDKPLLLYRPLVMRTEWGGCAARNPDYDAYYQIFSAIRDYFHVVSIADLEPTKEWLVGRQIEADVEFHRGELPFEALAALMQRATLSFASPGFATILAQSVGTPAVCVFGGYENSASFSAGRALAPYLGIDPVQPCQCFQHNHACRKAIDVPRAVARLLLFVEENVRGVDSDRQGGTSADQLELAL